jgi:hypothetical protein
MTVALPDAQSRWRCGHCGNLTRFDVTRSRRVTEYWHLDLAGEPHVENTELIQEIIERVSCRWCGADDAVDLVPRASISEADQKSSPA